MTGKKHIKTPLYNNIPKQFLGLQNTPTASRQKGKIPTVSVLDMTLNNLKVKLQ